MKQNLKLLAAFALATLATVHSVRAASHTWSGAVNSLWSNAGNWSAGGAPQLAEAGITLTFPAGATRYTSTNNIGNLAIDGITVSGNNYKIGGSAITLTGVAFYNLNCSGVNDEIAMDIALTSNYEYFNVDPSDSLTLSGVLSGTGGFTKFSQGALVLAGPGNNTYAYPTTVNGGMLDLAKSAGGIAIPGQITVGTQSTASKDSHLRWFASEQIPDAIIPTVNSTGELLLNGYNETVGGLNLQGGYVTTGAGLITLKGDIDSQQYNFGNIGMAPQLNGHLSLGGADRTFHVYGGYNTFCFANCTIEDGGNNAGLIKTGDAELDLYGANTYGGVTKINAGHVFLGNVSGLGSSAAGTVIAPGANLWVGPALTIAAEGLTVSGNGDGLYAALQFNDSSVWAGNIVLAADTKIGVYSTNSTAVISGTISGPGALHKVGPGRLTLAGSAANTYTGGTYVDDSMLMLGKTAALAAVPGPLFIGMTNADGNFNVIPKTNFVRLLAPQQIADTAPVYMQVNAALDLNGFAETVGNLTMYGSFITNNGGLLTLNSNVTFSSPWNNFPVITGDVSLGGATRTFTSLNEGALSLTGVVGDGGAAAGIIKMGVHGGLRLDGTNNTYTGVTTVNEGWLSAEQPGSLGSPVGGTVVNGGGMFEVALNFHGPTETLTVNDGGLFVSIGNNSWDGNIVLNGNANFFVDNAANNETLDLNGVISGPGNFMMLDGGTIRFGGGQANTYGGRTVVNGSGDITRPSTLELRKTNGVVAIPGALTIGSMTNSVNHEIVRLFSTNQIADTSAVTVNASGLFDLNSFNDTIGSLDGCGNINLVLASLTTGGNNASTIFSGVIAGISFTPLTKEGTGNMTLAGTNTCLGKMVVNHGNLYVNGSQTCGVQVNSTGKLRGQGNVGSITGTGGWAHPGDNLTMPNHGRMNCTSLVLDSTSGFNIDLGGTAASGNYDRIIVAGTVTLSNAVFNLTQSGMAKTNDQFTIIKNNSGLPVQGTFAGAPEGTTFGPLNGQLKLSYKGGASGNDVVLTQITVPPAPKFGQVTKLGNGGIQLTGTGVTGWIYTIQANTNLLTTNWTAIGSATADGSGQIQFVDPNAPNFPIRFYRFVAP